MKRLQLCASLTALVIGIVVAGSAQAGDKGQKGTSQSGAKNAALTTQSGAIANNLKKQGTTMLQNQSNGASSIKNKQIDPGKMIKKDKGSPGQQIAKKTQDPKMKEKHMNSIKDHCYFGKDNFFYSNHCWNSRFGCETYFCSTRNCWYFWYEPFGCYLPTEYWNIYCEPVIEVVEPVVTQPVVEVTQPVVEVTQPVLQVQTVRVVRPLVVVPSFGYCGPSFPYQMRYVRH